MTKDLSKLQELDRKHVWHPYTRHSAAQSGLPVIVRGEGCWLHDADGNTFFDGISSWWCCTLGHSHPELVEALTRQAATLQHSILGNLSHEPAIALAEALAGLMPDPHRHVHFASDGASAVEAAMKIAIQYAWQQGQPNRNRFVSLREAYHGDTLATLSLGFIEFFHKPFGRVRSTVHQVPVPPYDADSDEALEEARNIFAKHGDTIAGLIVEPLCQGAAGMRIYKPDFLARLTRIAQQHDALVICDEIAVGFGRTGSLFAFEQAGIDPDMVCLGKALSAGYAPISAVVVKDAIYDAFADNDADHTFYHGHTFAGNPIAAAVALKAQHIYREIDLPAKARELGGIIQSAWEGLEDHPGVAACRYLGLISAVELADQPGRSGSEAAARVQKSLLRQGLLVRPLGPVLYLMPPLVADSVSLKEQANRFRSAIEASGA